MGQRGAAEGQASAAPERGAGLYLLVVAVLVAGLYLSGAFAARVYLRDLAPQFADNTFFNQKLLFLKRSWPVRGPVKFVLGSSLAANDFDSAQLQTVAGQRVLNLGVDGFFLPEIQKFYTSVRPDFNVDEVIIVTQFNDLKGVGFSRIAVKPQIMSQYIGGRMNFLREFSYRNLVQTVNLWRDRRNILHNPSNYGSMDFDSTGAAPLQIHGAQIAPARWNALQLGVDPFDARGDCHGCGAALFRLCQSARATGVPISLVIPPLSNHILQSRPDIARWYAQGRTMIRSVGATCGAKVFDVAQAARVSDTCFADFAHLDADGARQITALYLAWRDGRRTPPGVAVSCPGPLPPAGL
jgi:hypothetical protein